MKRVFKIVFFWIVVVCFAMGIIHRDRIISALLIKIPIAVDRIVEVPVDPNNRDLTELITEESEMAGIPPLITLAMAHIESGTNLDRYATRFEPGVYARVSGENETERRAMASSHGLMQVMGFHVENCKLKHWSDLYQPTKNLRCGLKILNDCIKRFAKETSASVRFSRAFGCYNGDAERYPRLVKIALADLVINKLGEK